MDQVKFFEILEEVAKYRTLGESEQSEKLRSAKALLRTLSRSAEVSMIFDAESLSRLEKGLTYVDAAESGTSSAQQKSLMIGLLSSLVDAAWSHLIASDATKNLMTELVSNPEFRTFV